MKSFRKYSIDLEFLTDLSQEFELKLKSATRKKRIEKPKNYIPNIVI